MVIDIYKDLDGIQKATPAEKIKPMEKTENSWMASLRGSRGAPTSPSSAQSRPGRVVDRRAPVRPGRVGRGARRGRVSDEKLNIVRKENFGDTSGMWVISTEYAQKFFFFVLRMLLDFVKLFLL